MTEFKTTINSENGIHARPAGQLVQLASKYESDIIFKVGEKEANIKNGIFSLMGLGITNGNNINVIITGNDENKAAQNIKNFLNNLNSQKNDIGFQDS